MGQTEVYFNDITLHHFKHYEIDIKIDTHSNMFSKQNGMCSMRCSFTGNIKKSDCIILSGQ